MEARRVRAADQVRRLCQPAAMASRDGYSGSKRPLVNEVRFMVDARQRRREGRPCCAAISTWFRTCANADVEELKANPQARASRSRRTWASARCCSRRAIPLLSNVKLRQAIAAALDTPQIAAAVTEGLGKHEQLGGAADLGLSHRGSRAGLQIRSGRGQEAACRRRATRASRS